MAVKKIKKSLICHKTKRFESIFVCAANCRDHCSAYAENICIEALEYYVQQYPEYEIIGEIMPQAITPKKVKTEKLYLVKDADGKFSDVPEGEIMKNAKEYMNKEIWEKSPNQYELVVTLRKKIKK